VFTASTARDTVRVRAQARSCSTSESTLCDSPESGGTMELRQLEHVVAVAEEGSFTVAAQRANIVQSGLSMSIRALERELGGPLFVRGPKRVTLTATGRALLPEARRVIAAVHRAADAVAETNGLLRGTVSIGTAPALTFVFDLPALLAKFGAAYPNVRIEVRQDSAPEVLQNVRSGALDMGFVATDGDSKPRGVTTMQLARSPFGVVCSASHRLAGRRSVSLRELTREKFIDAGPEYTIRAIAEGIFSRAKSDRDTTIVVNDIVPMLAFVEQGLGVALLPEVVRRFPSNVRFVPLEGRQRWWHLLAVSASDRPPSAAVRTLLAMIPELVPSDR
jgi:DNA-binding transcriptional LysR family regulator